MAASAPAPAIATAVQITNLRTRFTCPHKNHRAASYVSRRAASISFGGLTRYSFGAVLRLQSALHLWPLLHIKGDPCAETSRTSCHCFSHYTQSHSSRRKPNRLRRRKRL